MAQAHAPTTFAALFNDASRDPFLVNGGYEIFLAPFQVEKKQQRRSVSGPSADFRRG
jgi:hypothetical protein